MPELNDARVAVYIDFDNIVISRYDRIHGRNAWRSDEARGATPRGEGEVAAKLAMAEQAEAQREDMLRAHVAEVRSMIHEWENFRERRARYARELLPLATERTQAVLTAYRGAKATLAEVLAARRSEIDVRMQALQLEMEQALLWAQLSFLLPHASHVAGVSQ